MTNQEAKRVMAVIDLCGFKSVEDTINNLKKHGIEVTPDIIIYLNDIVSDIIVDKSVSISTADYKDIIDKYKDNDRYVVLTQDTRSPILDYYEVTIISLDALVTSNIIVYKDIVGKNIIIMFYKEDKEC